MSVNRIALLHEIAEDFEEDEIDLQHKLQAIGPLLALCKRTLTEEEFRYWMRTFYIKYGDPLVEREVKDFVNLLHYAGIITITDRCEDTWMDDNNENAFKGVTDEGLAQLVRDINGDVERFEEMFG